jgi:hypothetical protein
LGIVVGIFNRSRIELLGISPHVSVEKEPLDEIRSRLTKPSITASHLTHDRYPVGTPITDSLAFPPIKASNRSEGLNFMFEAIKIASNWGLSDEDWFKFGKADAWAGRPKRPPEHDSQAASLYDLGYSEGTIERSPIKQ